MEAHLGDSRATFSILLYSKNKLKVTPSDCPVKNISKLFKTRRSVEKSFNQNYRKKKRGKAFFFHL